MNDSFYQYWIGEKLNYDQTWNDYIEGKGYIDKYKNVKQYLLRFQFNATDSFGALFHFEAVFNTIRGLYHDIKKSILTQEEYEKSGPIYLYQINRGSDIWTFVGDISNMLLLAVLISLHYPNQIMDNNSKKIDLFDKIKKNFPYAAFSQEYLNKILSLLNNPSYSKVIENLFKITKLEKVQLSSKPFSGKIKAMETDMIDIIYPEGKYFDNKRLHSISESSEAASFIRERQDKPFLKTTEFVKYKNTIVCIIGKEVWNNTFGMYIKRYKDFDCYKGGYARLARIINQAAVSLKDKPSTPQTKSKALNKLLLANIAMLKAEGYKKEL
jgi:hypothetical protein